MPKKNAPLPKPLVKAYIKDEASKLRPKPKRMPNGDRKK